MDWRKRYTQLARFLGEALGKNHEIVLHDLTGDSHSIIHISNPHVSGRSTSAPLSELALEFIYSRKYEECDHMLNYEGISAEGQALRCSTMFIKDDDGTLLGMFCINFNQHKYNTFAKGVLDFVTQNYAVEHPAGESDMLTLDLVENFHESVAQRFKTIVFGMFGEEYSTTSLTQSQKVEILRRLEECGVFRVKGAIPEVAGLMKTSVPSVYRYLAMLKKG